jgi:hypothetical protein
MKPWLLDIIAGVISILALILFIIVLPRYMNPATGYLLALVAFIAVMGVMGWKVIGMGYRAA